MGHKINPISFRLGINKTWHSRWYDENNYGQLIHDDLKVINVIEGICEYNELLIGDHKIWRSPKLYKLPNDTIKPSLFIHFQIYIPYEKHHFLDIQKKYEYVLKIKTDMVLYLYEYFNYEYYLNISIDPIFGLRDTGNSLKFFIDCLEKRNTSLLASWICSELHKKRGLKKILKKIEKSFDEIKKQDESIIKGIRISCTGRFKMTDTEKRRNKMARIKWLKLGQISLHKLQNKINYTYKPAFTTDGTCGVKIWISY